MSATVAPVVDVGIGPVSIQDIVDVARHGRGVRLTPAALTEIARTRRHIENLAAQPAPVYGVSTGFGALAELYYAYWGEFFHLAVFEAGDDPADVAAAYQRTHERYLEALDFVIAGSESEAGRDVQRIFLGLEEAVSGPAT